MKNIIFTIFLASMMLLNATQQLSAQVDGRNRLASTIVADVLNELPAKDDETFDRLMSEIISPDFDRTFEIFMLLQPDEDGSNAKVEYALQGVANYVSRPDKLHERQRFRVAIRKYIENPEVNGDKLFVISLFQAFGDMPDAEMLLSWVNDEIIGDASVRALASITP